MKRIRTPSSSQLRRLAVDPLAEHPHQALDLLGGPRPVLGREREHGQLLDPELDRVAQPRLDHVGAGLVALDRRQPALLRPAPVAVGDDRDVPRGGASHLEDLFFLALQQARRSRRSRRRSSFCSSASARRSSSSPTSPSFFSSRRSCMHVAADVAHRDPALLGHAVHDLDQLACGAPRSARGSGAGSRCRRWSASARGRTRGSPSRSP